MLTRPGRLQARSGSKLLEANVPLRAFGGVGLQKIVCFLFRYVRHSLGICDLLDQQSVFQWTFSYNKISHTIPIENTNKYEKWSQGPPKMWKLSTRVSKSEPRSTKREPKASQMEPKGSQRQPKGSQREPKVSQIQHKINIKEQVAKNERKRSHRTSVFGSLLGATFMKNRWTNRCKNRYRTSHVNWWNFDAKIKPDLDTFRRRRSWKNVFFGKGECA